MISHQILPRRSEFLLTQAIEYMPIVLIHGPRQCGKTTLAQAIGSPLGYTYHSFDDPKIREAAQDDPMGFIHNLSDRAILDEVQLVPELFRPLKLSVDSNRKPGRLILTGSTSAHFLSELNDALAGRMLIVCLHPLSQQELDQTTSTPFLERLFRGTFPMTKMEPLDKNLLERIVLGGYPALLAIPSGPIRTSWYSSYVLSLVQKDILEISGIRSIDTLPKLLTVVANMSSQLLNVSSLASNLQMNTNTIRSYLGLLERQFLIERLLPWSSNQMRRLVKTPKIHICDTGLACSLLDINVNFLKNNRTFLGHLVESFVFQELRRQSSSSNDPYRFYHFRDRDGVEVDLIIERGAFQLCGIEVKASFSVNSSDFKSLRKVKAAHSDRFAFGAVLYDGDTCASYGDRMYAIPIRMLWESQPKDDKLFKGTNG